MKNMLLVPVLLFASVALASSSITDGADPVGIAVAINDLPGTAGIEVFVSIDDGPEPIPPVVAFTAVWIEDSPEPFPTKGVALVQDDNSLVVRAVVDDKAADGLLVIVLEFADAKPVTLVIDLAGITDGADPV